MTDSQLQDYRRLFPVTERFCYLDHASNGPLPVPTVRAVTAFLERFSHEGGLPYPECDEVVEESRAMAARLMHVTPEEIAFARNTSQGIIIAIGSIDWRDGDNLVMMKDAFPADYYPYHYLLPQVEKRYVTSQEMAECPDCVFRLIDRRTRAVALDWVSFRDGIRSDIASVAEFCRPLGIRLIVDAIQGLGVVDMDFGRVGADFVCANCNKWLLSPQSIGILYVNASTLPGLKPYNLGWLSAKWEEFNDIFTPKPMKPGAARFEEGTKNYTCIHGLHESLRLLLEVGLPEIAARNRMLVDLLRKGLSDRGYNIHTPEEPRRSAGILTADRPGADMKELHRKLAVAKVICSLRDNRLRFAPHFYNTREEIARCLEVIDT